MSDRGAQHHRERLAVALREELATIVEGELADPRIGLATVSEVLLSPDGKSARVFVTVDGDDRQQEKALQGLQSAKNFIRRQMVDRLGLRHAPELIFQLDKSEQYGARIDQLLQRISKRKS
jgi:ribosome-binding factor A